MGKLEGKVAVVTGGTAGIGVGITQVFLDEGAKVVFCGRREEKGRELEQGYRGACHDATFVRCDMTVAMSPGCEARPIASRPGFSCYLSRNVSRSL